MIARALDACTALGVRAVVVTPYTGQLPAQLPASVYHADYVPFDLLLPKLAAVVHHGGIGTLAQGLAAGVPQLIAPHAHDQFDNAAQLARLGAGASASPHAGAGRWKRTLRGLLGDLNVAAACRSIKERCRTAPPAEERIADLVEALRAERR
jgi:rhamnosyltransferase subunit B